MAEQARAFWITAPNRGEIRDETLPAPTAEQALVRTLFTGISRGTETLVFGGRVPPSEHTRMRAPFQVGEFPAPVKYGYCNVGRVEQGPASLRGRNVFCLHPHQTRYVVPAAALTPLPDDLPPGRAVLAANLETAVNGLWDAAPRVGDRVAVVGAGTVGCLVAWLAARITGCDVELIDIDARKAQAAAALDVPFRTPENAARDVDVARGVFGRAERDVECGGRLCLARVDVDELHVAAGDACGEPCDQAADRACADDRDAIADTRRRVPQPVHGSFEIRSEHGATGRQIVRQRRERCGRHHVTCLVRMQTEHIAAAQTCRPLLDTADVAVAVLHGRREFANLERRAHARVLARRHTAAEHERLRAAADAGEERAYERLFGCGRGQRFVADFAAVRCCDPESARLFGHRPILATGR